jgi:hypothetical protein
MKDEPIVQVHSGYMRMQRQGSFEQIIVGI